MPYLGKVSTAKKEECLPELQKVLELGITAYDFSVLCGHRNEIDQNLLYPKFTKVFFPNSQHNKNPSEAFDICPYHTKYGKLVGNKEQIESIAEQEQLTCMETENFILQEYCIMAGVIKTAAKLVKVNIIWGGDWDRDGDRLDQKFNDLGHFEKV